MRRKLFTFVFVLLALSLPGFAQLTAGSITSSASTCPTTNTTSCVVLQLSQQIGQVAITVNGTFTAALQFEWSTDGGSSWVPLSATPNGGGTAVTSTTNGSGSVSVWTANVGGGSFARVRGSSYTSGVATVTLNPSQAAVATSTSGGSGNVSTSGTPTNTQIAQWVDATHVQGIPAGTTGTSVPLMWANSGTFNLMIGTGSGGVTNASGGNNVCLNASNLSCFFSLTSGATNIAIGQSALFSLTQGSFNVSIGNGLGGVTTGTDNVAIGNGAQSGGTNVSNVTAVGWNSLSSNQTVEASAFGNQSQHSNTTGLNSSFGSLSMLNNTTGTNNDVFGEDTLRDNVAGNRNVAMGARALQSDNGGNDNTAIGQVAGFTATTANANVTGNFNTWVGSGTGPGSTTQNSYQSAIGAGNTPQCNNCFVFGGDGLFGTLEVHPATPCETSFGISTLTAAYTTGLTCLPANSVIDAVLYRITTTITGTTTSFTIGDATIATRFCGTQSTLTAGTTGICFAQADQTGTSGPRQVAAAAAKFTANGTITAGAIRFIVYSHTWTPPTS